MKIIFILLLIFFFSGCAVKIDFKEFKRDKVAKTIQNRELPSIPLQNISVASFVDGIDEKRFKQLISFNSLYNKYFLKQPSDIRIELILTNIAYQKKFIPPKKKKNKTKYY